jgi:hypothetical protein
MTRGAAHRSGSNTRSASAGFDLESRWTLRQQRICGSCRGEIPRLPRPSISRRGHGGAIKPPVATTWLGNLLLAPLIAFALYRRFRRSFGRQNLRPKRMILRMVVLSAICALFLWWLPTLYGVSAAAAGTLLGGALALVDLRHTQLEVAGDGTFYTPNKWIGLLVTSLFVARLCARLVVVYQHSAEIGQGAPSASGLQKSPLTLGLYFLLAAYYVGFYAGILSRARAAPR